MVGTGDNMKKCSICQEIKSIDQFGSDKSRSDSKETQCKPCKRARRLKSYYKNREKELAKMKDYDKQRYLFRRKSKYWRKWRKKNPEKYKAACRKWVSKNKDKIRKYDRKRYHSDVRVRICKNITSGINHCVKGKNRHKWQDIVGFTYIQLRHHLERQFIEDMSWELFGRIDSSGIQREKWIEIDHIIPISQFSFNSIEHLEFKKCWSLDNLRPMWHSKNRSEGARRSE